MTRGFVCVYASIHTLADIVRKTHTHTKTHVTCCEEKKTQSVREENDGKPPEIYPINSRFSILSL